MLNNKVYDVLKWVALIALPAVALFIQTVFPVWGIGNVDAIVTTVNAVSVLVGALIGVSTVKYNKGGGTDED